MINTRHVLFLLTMNTPFPTTTNGICAIKVDNSLESIISEFKGKFNFDVDPEGSYRSYTHVKREKARQGGYSEVVMVKFSCLTFAWKRIKIASNTFLEDARRLIREAEVIQQLRTKLNGSEFQKSLIEVIGQKKDKGRYFYLDFSIN